MVKGQNQTLLYAVVLAFPCACYTGPVLEDPYVVYVAPAASPATLDCKSGVADALLSCQACHSDPPRGAPNALMTRTQLMARSSSDPSKTMAEISVLRMRDAKNPMPPSGTASPSDVEKVAAWITAGYPEGECGGGTNIFAAEPTCTSGIANVQVKEDTSMEPGGACQTCHQREEGKPIVSIGGTIYPSAHEPDRCAGAADAALSVVLVEDKTGTETRMAVNAGDNGNFASAKPFAAGRYHVHIEATGGARRSMSTALTLPADGDCNRCHTQEGTGGAPGRIVDPRTR